MNNYTGNIAYNRFGLFISLYDILKKLINKKTLNK